MAASSLDPVFNQAGAEWGVDPNLLRAQAMVESGGNPNTPNSSAGAQGLMQIMPATAQSLGVTDPHDPVQSIWGGAKLMSGLIDKYGNPELALAAYNAGEPAVDAALAGRRALSAETMAYVPKVGAAFQRLAPASDGATAPAAAAPGTAPPAQRPSDADMAQMLAGAAPAPSPLQTGPASPQAAPARPSDAAMAQMLGASPAPATAASAPPGPAPSGSAPAPSTGGFIAGLGDVAGRVLHDVTDRPAEALAGLADRLGVTNALASAGLPVPTAPQVVASDAAARAAFNPSGNPLMTAGRIGGDIAATIPLLATGGELLGGAGEIAAAGAGRVAPALGEAVGTGTDFLAGTASAPGNALMNTAVRGSSLAANGALQGAGAGALIGDPDSSLTHNMLMGGATGAAIGPALSGLAGAARYGGNALSGLVQPFTASGRDAIADAAIANAARGGPLAVDTTALVPGSAPTLAQATANPGIAGVERAVVAIRPNEFGERLAANNDARGNMLLGLTGTPTDIDLARAALDRQANATLPDALRFDANAVPLPPAPGDALSASTTAGAANPQPVVDLIDRILASPDGKRDAVRTALGDVRANLVLQPAQAATEGTPGAALYDTDTRSTVPQPGTPGAPAQPETLETDPAQLYGVRKSINDDLSPLARNAKPSAQLASAQLMQVRDALDNVLEGAAPGFKSYLQAYQDAAQPINAMRYLQSRGFTDPNGNVTLAKVNAAIQDIDKQRLLPGARDAKSVTPDTYDGLSALRDDLQRQNNSRLGLPIGSSTFQNLAVNSALSRLGAPLAWSASALNRLPVVGPLLTSGVQKAYAGQNEAVLDALTNRLLNPDAAAPALDRLAALGQRGQNPSGANPLLSIAGVDALDRLRRNTARQALPEPN